MSPGSRATLVVTLTLALLVGILLGVAAQPGTAQVATDDETVGPAENATMVVELEPDGDARWTVSIEFDLATAAERDAFRDLAADYENGETEQLGLQAFDRARAQATQATGRTMEFRSVTLGSSPAEEIDNGTGRLYAEFTWTNFAVRDNDTLQLEDVFDTDGGTWLPGLEANQRLLIRPPSGGGVIDASVSPRGDGTLVWEGPRDLNPDLLGATFTVRDAGPGNTLWWALALVASVGMALVLVYVGARRDRLPDIPDSVSTAGSSTADDPSPGATERASDRPATPAAGTTAPTAEETTEDLDLLSDEERVELLLEQNGGRMKQANIVRETGWSNAKVSQLLSAMEEEGHINKLRIGRENLISFPDENITGDE